MPSPATIGFQSTNKNYLSRFGISSLTMIIDDLQHTVFTELMEMELMRVLKDYVATWVRNGVRATTITGVAEVPTSPIRFIEHALSR